jgi:hypothetical protein
MDGLLARIYSVEWWDEMNWKVFGRKWLWHYLGICLEGPRKSAKMSVRIVGVLAGN